MTALLDGLLGQLDTLLLAVFSLSALTAATLMIFLRQPMRVAMALIYVGAVMVFMVYVIMLLEVRDHGVARYSRLLLPGVAGFAMVLGAILISIWRALPAPNKATGGAAFGIAKFSVAFVNEYWLQFELTSVLLVAAVVAALAVIRVSRRTDMTRPHG